MVLTPVGLAVADEDDPLAPEPANLADALIGYARVSTSGENLDRQARTLTKAGCIGVFAGKQPGKTAGRPELAACLDYLRAGDTLVVPGLDRLSRSQDLITFVAGLRRRGTGFRSLREAVRGKPGQQRRCLAVLPGRGAGQREPLHDESPDELGPGYA